MHQFPIALLCRVLGISRSGFYAWHRRAPSTRSSQDQVLCGRIEEIHVASHGTYGAPRIHAEMAEDGMQVGRKRVARIMRQKGIRGVSRRKWTTTTVRDASAQWPPTWSNGTLRPTVPTDCGWPTSPTCPRGQGFFIWQLCWTHGVDGLLDGRSPQTCESNSC